MVLARHDGHINTSKQYVYDTKFIKKKNNGHFLFRVTLGIPFAIWITKTFSRKRTKGSQSNHSGGPESANTVSIDPKKNPDIINSTPIELTSSQEKRHFNNSRRVRSSPLPSMLCRRRICHVKTFRGIPDEYSVKIYSFLLPPVNSTAPQLSCLFLLHVNKRQSHARSPEVSLGVYDELLDISSIDCADTQMTVECSIDPLI